MKAKLEQSKELCFTLNQIRDDNIRLVSDKSIYDDLDEQISRLSTLAPTNRKLAVPLVIGGYSLGGLMACATTLYSTDGVPTPSALVLLSPALATTHPQFFKSALLSFSDFTRSCILLFPFQALVCGVAQIAPNEDTKWTTEYVSDVCHERKLFAADPLISREIPTDYLYGVDSLMHDVLSDGRSLRVPVLIAAGVEDRIVRVTGTECLESNFGPLRDLLRTRHLCARAPSINASRTSRCIRT